MTTHGEKERSVLVSLIVDFLLLLPDIVVAVLANSVTLLADVLKCGNELVATLLAWLTLRRISKGSIAQYNYGLGKLENLSGMFVSTVMFISILIVIYEAIERIKEPVHLHGGGACMGIVMMFVGVCVNTWLWIKNYRIAQKENSPIMESQWHLFRAKAASDLTVLVALTLSLALKDYSWSVYADPLASFVITGFLLFSIYGVISHSVYDLLDKTLDESLQLIIVKELVNFFDDYHALHGVRSRRSGSITYIEIFLEFDGERKMQDVQAVIDRMKGSIENKIKGSSVLIAPSTSKVAP